MIIFIKNQTTAYGSSFIGIIKTYDNTMWVVLPQGLHKKIVNLFVPLSRVRCYTPIMTIHNALSMCSHTATILCLESHIASISVGRNRNRCLSPCGGEWVSIWPDQDGKLKVYVMMFNVLYIQYCIIHLSKYTGNNCLCGFRTPLRYLTVSCSSLAILIYDIYHYSYNKHYPKLDPFRCPVYIYPCHSLIKINTLYIFLKLIQVTNQKWKI